MHLIKKRIFVGKLLFELFSKCEVREEMEMTNALRVLGLAPVARETSCFCKAAIWIQAVILVR